MYKINVPGRGEITAPALLLTTTGRKSGDKFIFPLFYGTDGDSYIIVASKGGAPEHPGWYRNHPRQPGCRGASRDQEAEGAGQDSDGRGTRAALEKGARILAALCRLCAQDRTRDPGGRAGPYPLSKGVPQLQPWPLRGRKDNWTKRGVLRSFTWTVVARDRTNVRIREAWFCDPGDRCPVWSVARVCCLPSDLESVELA